MRSGTEPPPAGEAREHGATEAGTRLARASSVPLYFQLAEILKERIEAGRWPAGERFPSERELSEEFGISRTVIRPALDLLESDGQLVRVKGRGTFVTPPKVGCRVRGLTRLLSGSPEPEVEVRVLSTETRAPEPDVRELLELQPRAKVDQVTAVVLRSGSPIYMTNSFVARSRIPSFREALTGRGNTHAAPGTKPAFAPARATIATAFVSQWEAEQLELAAGDLCFLIRYVELLETPDGTHPVEFARIVVRSDLVELVADLA